MKIFPGLSYSLACQARTKIWVWSVLLLSIKHPQRINFFFLTFFCLFTLCCYIERKRKKSQEMYCFFTLLCSFSFLFYYLFLHKTSALISIFRIFKHWFKFSRYKWVFLIRVKLADSIYTNAVPIIDKFLVK